MLLNNGLKFAPVPALLSRTALVQAIERFQRSVRLRCMFNGSGMAPKFRVSNPAFVPQRAPAAVEQYLSDVEAALLAQYDAMHAEYQPMHNLNPAEKQVLHMLREQTELVLKPADKNLGLTLMRAAEYHAAVDAHVADTRVYEDVTASVRVVIQKTCDKLQRLADRYAALLGEKLQEFLLLGLKMCTPAHLYMMPKLHKMRSLTGPIVGRPIAACHSWVTTNMSKWLADKLNAALLKHDTVLIDRLQFLRELDGMTVSKNAWLLTFDVESLYPNVEHKGCIHACAAALSGSSLEKTMIEECMQFVLESNVVCMRGRYYRQIFGGAMGTNCMPPAAQLYLAIMWEGVIKQQLGAAFPVFFRRFIDDGFVVFEGSEQELLSFLDTLNTALPNIKITYHYSQFQVDFLDLVVYKCMEDALGNPSGKVRLKVRTHQKVLNKYLYIPYTSYHHHGVFKSFINAEIIRYVVTNSDSCWFDSMVRKFTHRLCQRGYPRHLIDSIASRVSHSDRHKYLWRENKPAATDRSVLVVPYAQIVPQMGLQRILREAWDAGGEALHTELKSRPIVAFTKNRNLGALLVKASH
jgi:hypothetical protein